MRNLKLYFCLCLFFLIHLNDSFAQYTPQTYIDAYKQLAIETMKEFGVPASVTLAIAMHESANGNSKVATYLNNHFGIRGQNNCKEIKSSYKGYDSVTASYRDFVDYLSTKKQFKPLFAKYTAYDYKNWAYGIGGGGYAASKNWATHVIAIIKKYQLFELDNRPPDYKEPLADRPTLTTSATYSVKKGDTLSEIAKKHGTTIKQLKQLNGLQTDRLKIGQRIKIKSI